MSSSLLLLALTACNEAPDSRENGGDPRGDSGGSVDSSVDLAARTHVGRAGPAGMTAIATAGGAVFVGTDRGLYRADTAGAELVLVGSSTARVLALTAFDGSIFEVRLADPATDAAAVLRIDPATLAEVDVTPADFVAWDNAEFATNGSLLALSASFQLFRWNAGAFVLDPNVIPGAIGFMGDRLFVDGSACGAGGVMAEREDGSFTAVDGLSDWGYSAFAYADGLSVTANPTALFAGEDGADWAKVHEDLGATALATSLWTDGSVVLATGSQGLLRSTAGSGTWTVLDATPSTADESLAAANGTILRLADFLQSSTDGGLTWADNPSDLALAAQVFVGGGTIYDRPAVQPYGITPPVKRADGDTFSSFLAAAREFAVTDTAWWACDTESCSTGAHGASGALATPPGWDMASGAGRLRTTPTDTFYDGCSGGTTLSRYDHGTWTEVGSGLPVPTGFKCPWRGAYETNVWLDGWASAGATLFATVAYDATYRSTDRGETWTPVTGARVTAAASCGAAIVAVDDAGALQRSTDGGATFSALDLDGGVALASFGGECFLGRTADDGAGFLLRSEDGAAFTDTGYDEGVTGLAADGEVLAISGTQSGVYRVELP